MNIELKMYESIGKYLDSLKNLSREKYYTIEIKINCIDAGYNFYDPQLYEIKDYELEKSPKVFVFKE